MQYGPTTEKSAHPNRHDAPHCTAKTSVLTPLHLPLSTRLGEISLPPASCPHRGRFWPILNTFDPPGTPRGPLQPNHLTCGARLAPATGGAPATFSAAAARPHQQSSRRIPGGDRNPRPAPPLPNVRGESRLAKPQHFMPGKLERIVFSEATAASFVKRIFMGTRSTKRHGATKQGKERDGQDLALARSYRHD
jgi:hypothetical protein